MKKENKILKKPIEQVFDVLNYVFLTLVAFVTLYPFWHVLVISLLPYSEMVKQNLYLFPSKITLEAYLFVIFSDGFLNSLYISVFLVIAVTAYQLLITSLAAFVLTKHDLPGRNFIFIFIIITMFFSGGLIPYFMLIKNIGLYNNILAMILPSAINAYNMIVVKTFFGGLPLEMEASAKIDGAGYLRIFFVIILPLSVPVLATIGLFIAVGMWNEWFAPMIFLPDKNLWPLALKIRDIVISGNLDPTMMGAYVPKSRLLGESIKMATVMISVIPILMVYPFIQKYFVKGVMIGAVKS